MSKTAYFDMFSGISGNMILGAFLDAGVNKDEFLGMIEGIAIENYSIEINRVIKQGISAIHIDVISGEDQPHRHLQHIEKIIDNSFLDQPVKVLAKEIFKNLAQAEAKIHNTTIEKIHFHEVGAIDAIIDIVGAAWCINKMDITRVYASPVNTGSGLVRCAHGLMPVPAPATQELLREAVTYAGEIKAELTTPTGAAIITTLTSAFGNQPQMKINNTSYGAGTWDLPIPNVLRLIIGEQENTILEKDTVIVTETNIDDMNPELYEYIMDCLFEAGALDVYYIPVIMKKSRPGILLTVLSTQDKYEDVTDILLKETTSIGIRSYKMQRKILKREIKTVKTSFGEINLKIVFRDGKAIRWKPEYEDCKKIATATKVPITEILQKIQEEIQLKNI